MIFKARSSAGFNNLAGAGAQAANAPKVATKANDTNFDPKHVVI
jgi:hypothetical protein